MTSVQLAKINQQAEIQSLLAQGTKKAEIAAKFGVSIHSIRNHKKPSRAELFKRFKVGAANACWEWFGQCENGYGRYNRCETLETYDKRRTR